MGAGGSIWSRWSSGPGSRKGETPRGGGLNIAASQLLIAHMEKRGPAGRTGVVFLTSAGYILSLTLFALGKGFWLMLAAFLLTGLMRSLKEPLLAPCERSKAERLQCSSRRPGAS